VAKNGNGEGSIYPHKRNGKKVGYRGAYRVYTASGPKRRYVTGRTREETRQKLTKAMADWDGGLIFEDGGLNVGEYVERWLKDSVRGTVRQSTYETYEYMTYPRTSSRLWDVSSSRPSPRSTCVVSTARNATGA
jgi:integrase